VLWDEHTDAELLELKKKAVRRFHEEGRHEAALHLLRCLPQDDPDVQRLLSAIHSGGESS
jgi:hypothetical protein